MPRRWPDCARDKCRGPSMPMPPWPGEIILRDRAYQRATWQWLQEEGARFYAQLQEMAGLTVWPGRANYLFLRCDRADFDLQYAPAAPACADPQLRQLPGAG